MNLKKDIDTKIIMYDGNIKCIKDIKINDYIMGDDSTPRKVLSISKKNDIMYKIINKLGESYKVDSNHILSLKYTIFKKKDTSFEFFIHTFLNKKYKYNKNQQEYTLNISVKQYLKCCYLFKQNLYGYKMPIEFKYTEINKDPYEFGKTYTKDSNEIINKNYVCNTIEIRQLLLAGILDSISYTFINYKCILNVKPIFGNSIVFLCRSLGIEAYYLINKENVILYNSDLLYEIKIIQLPKQDYYDFKLNNNNNKILLQDFTVF